VTTQDNSGSRFRTMPPGISLDSIMDAVQYDYGVGFCLSCGADRMGCEPDACNYPCEECGEDQVFGAEELIIMNVP